MKLFIKKLIYFLVFPIVFVLVMDIWLRNQESLYSVKYEGALLNKDSIEILILGNSHANYGVDPEAFEMYAYNMANVSQSIYFDKRLTTSLIDSLSNLKYVFISIDYHSLYFSSQGIRDIWSYYGNNIKYKNKNYILEDISPFFYGYTPKVSLSLLKKRVINFLKHGKECLSYNVETGVNLNDTLKKGFISFEDQFNSSFFTEEAYKSRINIFNNKIYSSTEKNEVLNDLDHFIDNLIINKIEPILYTTPTFINYNTYLDSSILDQNYNDIAGLSNKYDIPYLNFMHNPLFKRDDYYNADHLNKKGALKFAKMLNDTICKIQTNDKVYWSLME